MQHSIPRHTAARSWWFLRIPLHGHLVVLTLIWAGSLVLSFVVTLAIHRFDDVTGSIWEVYAGIAPWLMGFLGGYVMYVTVPLFISHGRTRRASFGDWALCASVSAVVAALLVTIGYLLEWGLYEIGGWPLTLTAEHLFAGHGDIGPISLEYLLTFLVWSSAGGFVGVSLYRMPKRGWLALIPGSLLVGIAGEVIRSPIGPFGAVADSWSALEGPSVPMSIAVAALCTSISVTSAWLVMRDMPLRNT